MLVERFLFKESKIVYYHFSIKLKDNKYESVCCELPGCRVIATDYDTIKKDSFSCLDSYLRDPQNTVELPCQFPQLLRGNIQRIRVDDKIVFSLLLRHIRNKYQYTQQEMAKKLKCKNLKNYQRLEKNTDPKLSTIQEIVKVFPDFPVQLLFYK